MAKVNIPGVFMHADKNENLHKTIWNYGKIDGKYGTKTLLETHHH